MEHWAGEVVEGEPDLLFRRGTDRFVKRMLGKQPLDVGADRIARTAHSALRLLAEVRQLTACPIPLAWSPQGKECPSAIEVYPAATLTAHGLLASGYKRPQDVAQRNAILQGLRQSLHINNEIAESLVSNADLLDAAVCVLAAQDFLGGRALPPPNLEEAKREGWIWAAGRGTELAEL